VPFPDEYHWGAGDASAEALAALRTAFKTSVDPRQVACVVIEPVQGEGGFIPAPASYLRGLRELCDEHGIVLIADEVQTGFGRTGSFFAIEQSGVEPDLICVAKSIAAGLPLSGVLGRASIMDSPGDSAIGGTYVGNPVACQAGLAVLDEIDRLGLVARARTIGTTMRARFEALQARVPQLGDVRGLGSMLALEFVEDRVSRAPDAVLAARVVELALQRGVILLRAGLAGNCIRNLAPLTLTDDQLDEALGVLEGAILDATRAAAAA
jgi:4-aminobutyrate aminotransferase/(S)-3-amino-2-methylpropionate transaminase